MLRFGFVLALAALATTAAAGSSEVTPATDQPAAKRLATLMDINRDGVISREEFRRRNADRASWRALDRNQDGVLDDAEQAGGLRPGPRIAR